MGPKREQVLTPVLFGSDVQNTQDDTSASEFLAIDQTNKSNSMSWFTSSVLSNSLEQPTDGAIHSNFVRPTIEEDYENEPPLLEELGINFQHIWVKTKGVLVPFKEVDLSLMDDTDLIGPLVFCLILGFFLMISGKLHFGYIYGFGLFGCIAISVVVNLMSQKGMNFWHVSSILGYCLLPVVILSALAIIINMRTNFGLVLAAVTILWCSLTSTRLFERTLSMSEQKWLIAYPIALFYSCFVLITIF